MIFGEEYIIKNKFHIYEKSISIDKVVIKRIVLCNKESYNNKGSHKYFIGYIPKGNALPSPLCRKFPQMNAYAKYFDKNNKCMNRLVNDKDILEKCNEIWDKIKNLFAKEFDSEPVYNDKYIKIKINLYNRNLYVNKTPLEAEHYTCFSVILLDFRLK